MACRGPVCPPEVRVGLTQPPQLPGTYVALVATSFRGAARQPQHMPVTPRRRFALGIEPSSRSGHPASARSPTDYDPDKLFD